MSFNKLKQNRDAAIQKLLGAAAAGAKPNYSGDSEGYWQPTVDKAGNGSAIIRFLPGAEGDDLPWAKYWDHGFKGIVTGRWFIEKSLTSIGSECPVSKMNSRLWNTGLESDKEKVRARKRRLHYVSNILVISDPENPEAEGKVFKFKYGKKIFDKIEEAMKTEFADEVAINPFDFWGGANFKLKIRQVEGYRNYDKSAFDASTELFKGDEAKLEALYGQLQSLASYTDQANYKSYAELEKKLVEVLGAEEVFGADGLSSLPQPVAAPTQRSVVPVDKDEDADDDIDLSPPAKTKGASAEEDSLSYFANLANK